MLYVAMLRDRLPTSEFMPTFGHLRHVSDLQYKFTLVEKGKVGAHLLSIRCLRNESISWKPPHIH